MYDGMSERKRSCPAVSLRRGAAQAVRRRRGRKQGLRKRCRSRVAAAPRRCASARRSTAAMHAVRPRARRDARCGAASPLKPKVTEPRDATQGALRTTAAAARCGLPGTSFSTGSRCQSSPAHAPARFSCRARRAIAVALPPAPQLRRARLVRVVELVVHEARDDGRLADRLVAQENELVLCERTDGRRHRNRLPVSAAPRRAGRLHAAVLEDGRGASAGADVVRLYVDRQTNQQGAGWSQRYDEGVLVTVAGRTHTSARYASSCRCTARGPSSLGPWA